MKEYKKVPWTENERRILQLYYYTVSRGVLLNLLPTRNMNSIRKQVKYLKDRGRRFDRNG